MKQHEEKVGMTDMLDAVFSLVVASLLITFGINLYQTTNFDESVRKTSNQVKQFIDLVIEPWTKSK